MKSKPAVKYAMAKQYHTINEGIPKGRKGGNANRIGIDTGNRNWLHVWIGHDEEVKVGRKTETMFVSQSVHLTREDALNLIEEIRHRLFSSKLK